LRYQALALVATLIAPTLGAQSPRLKAAEVGQWREDLEFLRTQAPAHHANLFHQMAPRQFDSALTSIESRLPSMSRVQVVVELEKLAAMIGDGHSNVGPWRDSVIAFHTLPVAFYWFPEGMVVRAADSAHASLLGARVVAINGVPIDAAIARVRPLISRDNEMGVRAYTPFLLAMPEVLEGSGIASNMERVPITFRLGDRESTVTLAPAGLFPMLTGDIDRSWVRRPGWVDARDGKPDAQWLSDPLDIYWCSYLPASRTMYVQINTIQQKPADSLRAFMTRAIAAADSARADKLVLDLRLNGGGNGYFNKDILLPIIKSRYDTAGHLYVITSRRTFSAAQMLVTQLQEYTTAIFVGEPTASKGNAYGDSYRIVLPNSKVTVRVSTLWWQLLDPRDKEDMIAPAIRAPLSFADYAAGRDPALSAIPR
jgi:hypothetical protein